MLKKNKFEKTIQTEICNIIKAPIKFNKNQILSNKKYEEKKEVKIYQMQFNSIIVTAPSLYDDINKEINNIGKDIRVYIDQLKNSLNLDKHKVGKKTIYLFLNPFI